MLWMILSAIGLICIGHSLNIAMLENNGTLWMNGESLPMILASMSSAVIVLKHLPNRSNPLINKLARGSFDIYLIHMNHFVYFWLWNKAIPISSFYDKPYFIFFICGSGIVVFLISLFIGNIRSSISAVVWSKVKWNKLQSIIDKVDTIVNQQEGERE